MLTSVNVSRSQYNVTVQFVFVHMYDFTCLRDGLCVVILCCGRTSVYCQQDINSHVSAAVIDYRYYTDCKLSEEVGCFLQTP